MRAAAPALQELLDSGRFPKGRVLVPGAGAGHDVLALADAGRDTVGLDIAPTAVERFRTLRDRSDVSADHATMVEADYFRFEPDRPFDAMWDATFLCAIDPLRRWEWATTAARLLRPGGDLIVLLFPVPEAKARASVVAAEAGDGPPYPVVPDHIDALVQDAFARIEIRSVLDGHPKRAGREWLGRWRRRFG